MHAWYLQEACLQIQMKFQQDEKNKAGPMEPLQERLHALARWAALSSQTHLLLLVKMLDPQVKTGPVAYCLVHDIYPCLLLASELLSHTPTSSNATVVGRDLFDVITDNGLGFPLLLELPDALLKVGQRVLQPLWTLIEVPRALFLKHCLKPMPCPLSDGAAVD